MISWLSEACAPARGSDICPFAQGQTWALVLSRRLHTLWALAGPEKPGPWLLRPSGAVIRSIPEQCHSSDQSGAVVTTCS